MILLHIVQHAPLLTNAVQHAHTTLSSTLAAGVHNGVVQMQATPPTITGGAPGNTSAQTNLNNVATFANNVQTLITWIGYCVFGIGIACAGIMRMVSMGNERRVAMSNMALTAAVIGLVIMLLANGILDFVKNQFPQ